MKLVTPGDTSNSYLWHKLIGDQNTLSSQCAQAATTCVDCSANTPCGALMPYLGESLAAASPDGLCAIENWISQGAQNN